MKRVLAKDLSANVLKLPRLPIPSLEQTAERYRASILPLKPTETAKAHFLKFDMFVSSSGATLQKALVAADKAAEAEGGYPYSYIEPIWDRMYLSNRAPLPVNTNPSILIKKVQNMGETQASVAATLVCGIARWVRNVLKEGVEVRGADMDLSPLLRQLGASLFPGEKADEFHTTPLEKLRHIIVLHDGHPYTVRVFDDQQVPLEQTVVQQCLEYILSITPDTDNTTPVSVLTAANREVWAGAYAELVKTPVNAETLQKVHEGMVVLCLDSNKWHNEDQLKNGAMLHGNKEEAENRWYDKHQIIVSADGEVAFNFEHAGSDAVHWARWIGDVLQDIEQSAPAPTAAAVDATQVTALVEPLRVTFGKAFAGHIRSARTEALDLIANTALGHLHLPFGAAQLKQLGVSPDAFVQMCFHVAFHKCRNKLAPTYEAASTARFFHGRTETIRSATQEMLKLAEAVNRETKEDAAPDETGRGALLALIKAASERHVTLARAASNGEGVDRHLTALNRLAVERGDNTALNFFNDEAYKTCCKWTLSTSNVSYPWMERLVFGPVTPNGYGLGYVVDEDEVRIMLSAFTRSPSTNVEDLKAAIQHSATRLHQALSAAKP
ncbi:carnitine/choline acetyltransferase [Trypanosoma conorhini]|uniref:Carnitine/choline acetyltransferase n=1 Tax=Trypanosoma conorhini TaxID=83891 RepID=A0A3R7LEG8_9TRYP|nr:carnitine/choline acetyltransferase [Trypanosoma conorhini]RNF25619.1 carnitine/choline acetyltransferase [Trypanosoma conorhini]